MVSGTTILADALAKELSIIHLEADDFLWLPSDPLYQNLADNTQRGERLLKETRFHGRAVVACSVMGWCQPLENGFDLLVFLYLPVELRLEIKTSRGKTLRSSKTGVSGLGSPV
ncbi:hypothetical protein Q1W70_23310 [Pseudomonas kielensis]|uniref:hypothetical protein n=1 Tax=Pseudomonas kielensis TaxID=2762577 RepID=UPI00265EC7A2|nr:hypothetical protein [Pseudomonas kielensis]WKL52339.1 hypothetical protein Q1W70_23310 [Pseudomonas kielensis]